MSRDREKIKAELEQLERNGIVKPADVVEFARNPETALHACFEWDDTEAAQQWRIEQARAVIRCYVVVEDSKPAEPVRAFVALRGDRKEGGGYRKFADVMSNEQLHAALMRDALTDLKSAQRRFAKLTELTKVFREVDKAERAFERQQKRGKKDAA